MYTRIRFFLADQSGQDLTEYALVVGLLGLGAVASMGGVASTVLNMLHTINTSLQNAV